MQKLAFQAGSLGLDVFYTQVGATTEIQAVVRGRDRP